MSGYHDDYSPGAIETDDGWDLGSREGSEVPVRGGAHRKARPSSSGRRPASASREGRQPPDSAGATVSANGRAGRSVPANGRRRAPRRRRRHPILAFLAALVALLLVAVLAGVIYANHQINPGGQQGSKVPVTIPAHSSTTEIGTILAASGVIHSAKLFPYWAKITGVTNLLPGKYELATNESYSDAVTTLQKGPVVVVVTDKLTIPEGFTLDQIAARVAALPHMGLSAAKFLAASTSGRIHSPYEPAGTTNLEGLVFPATYQVRQGQTEADVLQEMVAAFDENATTLNLTAGAAKLGMTPYQVVTVASIVEREAKLDADRPNVASAIYNRLVKGMTLGADSTQTYFLRLTDPTLLPTVAQLETPSPYNTRLNTGLPPTPVANPGIPSLRAAVSPASSTYLYFVEVNPDGQLGFASTDTGFRQLQDQCRAANLC